MRDFQPNAAVTGIGSLPHRNPGEACDFVMRHAPAVPFWPQLPQRSALESLAGQFAGGLPGLQEGSLRVDLGDPALGGALEKFYERYLAGDPALFAIDEERAAGLYALQEKLSGNDRVLAVKGQVTGPVSFGLQLVDEGKRFLLYSDLYRDVLVKQIQMKARWLEGFLVRLTSGRAPAIIFYDEPLLYTYGSAYFNVPREIVVGTLRESMDGVSSLKGIHACQNCDWSLLFEAGPDIISFDAFSHLDQFLLYPDQLQAFLRGGGLLAWGIVPTNGEEYLGLSSDDLYAKLESALERLEAWGLDPAQVISRSLITPACGTGTLPLEHAQRVFSLADEVSVRLGSR